MNPEAPHHETETEREQPALPIGVGGFESDQSDALEGEGDSLGGGKGKYLLIAVVLIAVAVLVSMRTLARVTLAGQSGDAEKMIEAFLEERGVTADGESADLIKDDFSTLHVLNETYSERQVPLGEVQRNPFLIWRPAPDERPTIPNGLTEEERRLAELKQLRAEKEREFAQAASALSLKSVLSGSNPVANISGNIVRVGDTFLSGPKKVEFLVREITTEQAVIEATDEELEMTRVYTVEIERPEP